MPFDILSLGILLVIVFSLVLYAGKSAGISAIFALPLSAVTYNIFPYKDIVLNFGKSPLQGELIKATIVALFFIIIYIIIRRGVSVVFPWNPAGKIIQTALISIILTGLIAIFVNNYIDGEIVTHYLPILKTILSLPHILFWWTIGTLVFLFFVLER